jgi:hypothetical protein
MTWFF